MGQVRLPPLPPRPAPLPHHHVTADTQADHSGCTSSVTTPVLSCRSFSIPFDLEEGPLLLGWASHHWSYSLCTLPQFPPLLRPRLSRGVAGCVWGCVRHCFGIPFGVLSPAPTCHPHFLSPSVGHPPTKPAAAAWPLAPGPCGNRRQPSRVGGSMGNKKFQSPNACPVYI